MIFSGTGAPTSKLAMTLGSIWNAAVQLGVPRPTPVELVLLVLLAAYLFALRANRERFVQVWALGWTALLVSEFIANGWTTKIPARYVPVAEQALFMLAVGLLSAGVLFYTRSKDLLVPAAVIMPVLAGFAAARLLMWPDSVPLRFALEVGYRVVLLTAALVLLRARRGRFELGSWAMALSLLSLHLDWPGFTDRLPESTFAAAEIVLGFSMLMIVFDDVRAKGRRLAASQALSAGIANAQQYGSMVQVALRELKRLTGVRVAWFRIMEGGHLVATHAAGTSPDFVRDAGFAELSEELNHVLEEGRPLAVARDKAIGEDPDCLKDAKLRHLLLLPVIGKKGPVGMLYLGRVLGIHWTEEELDFLQASARQLAIAIENLRLLEQVLRSQRQWMNTFDSIHDIILAHDSDFRIIKANQVLLEHLGKSAADVLSNSCDSVLPHNYGEWTGCPYCAVGGDEDFSEGADPCFGGFSVVSTSSYSEQGSDRKGVIHVIRDITDRRSAEEKYRLLFEQVQEGVYVATPSGRILDCNDALVHMLGYGKREEVLALSLDSDICVDPNQREAFRKEMEAHNYVRNFEVTLRRKDGGLLLAAESSFATRDAQGNIERYQGFVLDVTEKRRAEEEMRRRNRELNALNAMAVVATQSFDLDEILNLTLRQVVSLFGAESGSVYLSDTDAPTYRRRAAWGPRSRDKSRPAEIGFPDGFGNLVMRSRTEVISAEYLPHLPPKVAEFVRSDEDRSWIWVLFWGKDSPIGIMGLCSNAGYEYSSAEENLLVAISRQLATTIEKVRLYEETCRAYEDLRKTQEQLLQSEKMSAVGQLIAGVAHELNNPLTAILGYAQLLETEGLNERANEYVGKLFKQAQRTHRVVQNLLSFARQRTPQRDEVDIRKVLEETLTLRDYDLKINHIEVEKEIPERPEVVVADPHQIEQVFLNIINNAVDAILETGRPGKLKIRIHSGNGQVCTSFADDGPGLKDPKRIFDPFYTTKSVGKGTGLGLSICYGIVKEHGGDITAQNGKDGGAIIEVRLPKSDAEIAKQPEPVVTVPKKRESVIEGRILLVEEEESVLEFERDVLMGAGANVVTARKSEDVKTRILSEPFDAVIMNGKMQGDWTASEAFTWLKTHAPGTENHLLFTYSNAVEQQDSRSFLQESNAPYLVKPFEVADLIAQARKLMPKEKAAAASAS